MSSHEHDADMGSLQDEKKDEKAEHGHGHSHEHAHGHTSARIVAIGTVTLGGATFAIDREGQIESGKETEFGVEHVGGVGGVAPSAAWLANPDGTKVCEPAMPEGHDQHWHFNVNPLVPSKSRSLSCASARRRRSSTTVAARSRSTMASCRCSNAPLIRSGAGTSS